MRGCVREARGEADRVEELGDAARGRRPAGQTRCTCSGSARVAQTRQARVERGVGVLEDHLEVAAGGGKLGGAAEPEVAPVQPDGAPGRGDELEDGAGQRRLAAARFADEAEDLAVRERR